MPAAMPVAPVSSSFLRKISSRRGASASSFALRAGSALPKANGTSAGADSDVGSTAGAGDAGVGATGGVADPHPQTSATLPKIFPSADTKTSLTNAATNPQPSNVGPGSADGQVEGLGGAQRRLVC